MEDGYAVSRINGEFIGFYRKDQPMPRACKSPAVMTRNGWVEIREQSYILFHSDGSKTVIPTKELNKDQFMED